MCEKQVSVDSRTKIYIETALINYANSGNCDIMYIPRCVGMVIICGIEACSRYISYVLQLCKQREKLEFRLISGRIVNDFQYVADPNMFLSGAASYLRLDNNCPINRIAMVNNSVMEDRLSEYFDQVWNLDDQNVTKERNAIAEHIHHVLQGIHLITRAKSDEMEELQENWMNKI